MSLTSALASHVILSEAKNLCSLPDDGERNGTAEILLPPKTGGLRMTSINPDVRPTAGCLAPPS
jgi:hypothetical protein